VPAIPARIPARFPPTWSYATGSRATFARHAIVASDNRLAAEVGAEIMKQGGNAIDAAVATGFALAVAFPEAGNLGGGGYMVIRLADGRVAALDYREMAPLAATRDMYIGANGKLTGESVFGPRASGVPGAVAGMLEAHRKYGVLPLAKVLAPAIRLASDGFLVDSTLVRSLADEKYRIESFAGKSVFFPHRPPAPDGIAASPATIGAHDKADFGQRRRGVLSRKHRRFNRRTDAAGRRAHHQSRSRAISARLARAYPELLPRLLAHLDAAVFVGRNYRDGDVEHSRGVWPACSIRDCRASSCGRVGVATRVRRSQLEARRSGVRARSAVDAYEQIVREDSCQIHLARSR